VFVCGVCLGNDKWALYIVVCNVEDHIVLYRMCSVLRAISIHVRSECLFVGLTLVSVSVSSVCIFTIAHWVVWHVCISVHSWIEIIRTSVNASHRLVCLLFCLNLTDTGFSWRQQFTHTTPRAPTFVRRSKLCKRRCVFGHVVVGQSR
jgi:hypothetical protein